MFYPLQERAQPIFAQITKYTCIYRIDSDNIMELDKSSSIIVNKYAVSCSQKKDYEPIGTAVALYGVF